MNKIRNKKQMTRWSDQIKTSMKIKNQAWKNHLHKKIEIKKHKKELLLQKGKNGRYLEQ